ncbi:unnamed protein product [Schistocephalus solidus]|uniref:C2H2-type domain-containing protein n=1 Tax=Schistocephalus solidus TaxID=70667 RepID=A0A183SSX7_SCHSO|nr:unnamed protein product [Schistocephalus solidus]
MERPPCEDGRRTITQTTLLWRCRHGFSSTRWSNTTLKGQSEHFPKQLQINPATWEDLAWKRPAWRRTVTAIYEANRLATTKKKRAAQKSSAPRTNTANAQALPTCPRCQRTFRARIGLVGHLRTQCTNNPTIPNSTSNSANPPSDSPTLTLGINPITPTIKETTSQYSSSVTSSSTTTTATAATTTISDGDNLRNCPQYDRTFTSRIGVVGHL